MSFTDKKTLQAIAFFLACVILVFVIFQLSDRLSWCNTLIRVLISAFVSVFLFVIPNINQLKLSVPKGVTAFGAIGVFLILVLFPIKCQENNFYAFNVSAIDFSSKKTIPDTRLELIGDALGGPLYFDEYVNGTSINGNFNIQENKSIKIRCSHPRYVTFDTILQINNLNNNKSVLLSLTSLSAKKIVFPVKIDYSKYLFLSSQDTTNSSEGIRDLYSHYNNELFNKFHEHLLKDTISGVTLLAAPGGYGKSFVVSDNVITSVDKLISAIEFEFPKDAIGETIMVADLKVDLISSNENIILGELLSLDTFAVELYYDSPDLFDPLKKKVILFDGLDEIHPTSAEMIIRNIEDNYKKYPNTYFLLLARPETFNEYFSNPSLVQDDNIKFFQLSEVHYKTLGDLKLRVSNICGYLPGVCKDISFDKLVNTCATILKANPEMNEAFGNLRISKDFISYVSTKIKSGNEPNLDELKAYIISRIFDDEKTKHNRPSSIDREIFGYELYFAMLKEAAKKYSTQISINGSFLVLDNDIVTFTFRGIDYSFFVRDLLDRSGFIDMEPADTPAKLYRFNPSFAFNYFLLQ